MSKAKATAPKPVNDFEARKKAQIFKYGPVDRLALLEDELAHWKGQKSGKGKEGAIARIEREIAEYKEFMDKV